MQVYIEFAHFMTVGQETGGVQLYNAWMQTYMYLSIRLLTLQESLARVAQTSVNIYTLKFEKYIYADSGPVAADDA